MEDLSRANTHFTLDLFRKLSETNEVGNIFFSPLSISLALAMVYGGAKTNTASQIAKVFHFDKVVDLHSGFQTLQLDINKAGAPYVLKTANRLYGEKTFNFLEEFIQTCIKLYGANLLEVNFQNAADEARQEINKWVEDQTEGKIQDLLAPGTIDNLTKLVLVNAIYFKGSWAEKFDEKVTEEMPFKLNKNESRPVKMMYLMKKFRFNYIPEAKCKVLELPYVGKELNMIIMLPDDIEDGTPGLKQLETKLTLENLQKWTKLNSGPVEVQVRLPKFKLEDNYELGSILSTLGMQDLFDNAKADLSGMSGCRDLYMSRVVHKSFLEVNEEGTEAAAATAAIATFCMITREEIFTADRPFLFFIRHTKTNSILFFGRFSSP